MTDLSFSEGRVDTGGDHFELCYGSGDDEPATWIVVARMSGDENDRPVVDFVVDRSRADADALLQRARLRIETALDPASPSNTIVGFVGPGGEYLHSWRGTLAAICGSTSNWYGDWHWRARRGSA